VVCIPSKAPKIRNQTLTLKADIGDPGLAGADFLRQNFFKMKKSFDHKIVKRNDLSAENKKRVILERKYFYLKFKF